MRAAAETIGHRRQSRLPHGVEKAKVLLQCVGYRTEVGIYGKLAMLPPVSQTDMPARRLEDRIRELCTRLVYEKEPEWGGTVKELQHAIQEHVRRLGNAAAAATVAGQLEAWKDRRDR